MWRPLYAHNRLITVFLNEGIETASKKTFVPTYFTNRILWNNCDTLDDGIALRTEDVVSSQLDPIKNQDLEIFFKTSKSSESHKSVSSNMGTDDTKDPHDKIGKIKKRFEASQSKFFSFWNKENK